MNKPKKLIALEKEISKDKKLPFRRANLVFGEGSLSPKVMFIGEAPGRNEDEQKRPFVGHSGKLLNKMIEAIGWRREDVYITNIVKRRPPENRDPNPKEISAYRPYLTRQIEIINPTLIVTLGRFSMNYFLPEEKITKAQGKVFKIGGRFVYPILHPMAAGRSTKMMNSFKKSFKNLPRALKKIKSAPVRG